MKLNLSAPILSAGPWIASILIASGLFLLDAFPALYGDEYGSLFDAYNLRGNIHAIGYFLQLRIWNSIWQADIFLRSLSLFWFLFGLYWLKKWLDFEGLPNNVKTLTIWLFVLNPFLWVYAIQIRFYAFFLAVSILFIWRFRLWFKIRSLKNLLFLVISVLFLVTSHLFGYLVAGIVLLSFFWENLSSRNRWIALSLLAIGLFLIFLPPIRSILVSIVYRTSNPYASIPTGEVIRGLNLAMVAKIPFTFYFFSLGERVYPPWWWLSVPAMLVTSFAFVLGIWQLRRFTQLTVMTITMFLSVPLLFLVFDPLAPPGLQGAGSRYLIFVVPFFILVLALGAHSWPRLKWALIAINLAGLYCLAFPTWSYTPSDLINWPNLLSDINITPDSVCVITDGRAKSPVQRYLTADFRVAYQGRLDDCEEYNVIVLISSDYRTSILTPFDKWSTILKHQGYGLVSNTTIFPAHITVYSRAAFDPSGVIPTRLLLPEQDLRFPLLANEPKIYIRGFTRLTGEANEVTTTVNVSDISTLVLTNYRPGVTPPKPGEPVFRLLFQSNGDVQREVLLRSGVETAAWDGGCSECLSVYQWIKQSHLLGAQSYPGAYRQYQASIFGFYIQNLNLESGISSLEITYLLPDGEGYFYGIFEPVE
jgi:hypothetical protein